jgi:hypothetical protein
MRIPILTIRSICLTNPKIPNPKNRNLDLQKKRSLYLCLYQGADIALCPDILIIVALAQWLVF